MSDRIIVDYPEPKYRGFLHTVFNTIEDPVEEIGITNYIINHYKYDRVPNFQWLIDRLFHGDDYHYSEDQNNFLRYLLLILRIGKKAIKESNPIFEKYKEGLLPLIQECLTEKDGTQRLYKCVKLGEWIIKNITEFDWTYMDPPKEKRKSGTKSSGEKPKKIEGDFPVKEGDIEDRGVPSGKAPKEATSGADKGEEPKAKEEGKSEKMDDTTRSMLDSSEDADLDELEDYFDGELDLEADKHVVVDVSESVELSGDIMPVLEMRIEKFSDLINAISKAFLLLTARTKPQLETGYRSGKLDIRKAIQCEMKKDAGLKVWSKEISKGKKPDPVVSIICDNSGSMMGRKSSICCDATLGLATALEKSNIPFEVWGFTKNYDGWTGTSISLLLKKIEDKLNPKLPFFGINDSNLIYSYYNNSTGIPFFRGNSEEVNINFISKDFLKRKEARKIMIVLCDGGTTGRRGQLQKVIKDLENKGVLVIAIGIMDDFVKNYYSNYKIFKTMEELQALPEFMIEIIQNYCK